MTLNALFPTLLAETAAPSFEINIFEQMIESRGVVLGVLVVLLLMSVVCWLIVVYKAAMFFRLRRQSAQFLKAFWDGESLDAVQEQAQHLRASPLTRIFDAGLGELDRVNAARAGGNGNGGRLEGSGLDNVERAILRTASGEVTRLEKMVPFLATTGSSAPFIGLFGTVWGIMKAFAYIHPDRPILETVTPHIAQALVATAIGLLAAIPAVMAYNYFVSKIKELTSQMEGFSTDLLNILRRHYI